MASQGEQSKPEQKSERNVVIAVDESKNSEYAFEFYVKNIHHPKDNIILVHCSEYTSIVQAPALLTDPVVVKELIHEEEKKIKAIVDKYSELMKKSHLGGKVKQMTGKVGEAIIEAAKSENAAMIVTGTRGMGKVRRTFLGSVSDYCLHHSPVPVLVCRHKETHQEAK